MPPLIGKRFRHHRTSPADGGRLRRDAGNGTTVDLIQMVVPSNEAMLHSLAWDVLIPFGISLKHIPSDRNQEQPWNHRAGDIMLRRSATWRKALAEQSTLKVGTLFVLVAGMPAAAVAHTGVGATHGFAVGFAHPIGGLDHILAMIAVGLYAVLLGGRALWLVPSSFVLMMIAGALLGIAGVQLPLVEVGIAASVVTLGLAVALRWNASALGAAALVGFFALFHGHAHGAEMPAAASSLSYAFGFVLATTILHLSGIAMGKATARLPRVATGAAGGLMAATGVAMLAGGL